MPEHSPFFRRLRPVELVAFDGQPLWTGAAGRSGAWYGQHVEIAISDAMPDCIVITLHDEAEHPTIEISPAEARELIAGLAAVL